MNVDSAMFREPAELDFVTLGMFIIDEIHFPTLADRITPSRPPALDILGGAGSYSALGARILSPGPLAARVGWVVDAGSDFPRQLREVIAGWGTSCHVRETPERLTTRGWNGYGENEHRAFRYLTPKLRLDHTSLPSAFLLAKSFHLICSATRCIELVASLMARRESVCKEMNVQNSRKPLFIWEPVPDMCSPAELPACLEALKHVDVVSPNHAELCAFFGTVPHDGHGNVNVVGIERCCSAWLESGIAQDGRGAVVVRAGKDGCYITTRDLTTSHGNGTWVPAFHGNDTCGDGAKVVDPTGGGNTFLGGLAVSLARAKDPTRAQAMVAAAICGSVAASFAIEQIGMPTLSRSELGHEEWNGDEAGKRVARLKQYMLDGDNRVKIA